MAGIPSLVPEEEQGGGPEDQSPRPTKRLRTSSPLPSIPHSHVVHTSQSSRRHPQPYSLSASPQLPPSRSLPSRLPGHQADEINTDIDTDTDTDTDIAATHRARRVALDRTLRHARSHLVELVRAGKDDEAGSVADIGGWPVLAGEGESISIDQAALLVGRLADLVRLYTQAVARQMQEVEGARDLKSGSAGPRGAPSAPGNAQGELRRAMNLHTGVDDHALLGSPSERTERIVDHAALAETAAVPKAYGPNSALSIGTDKGTGTGGMEQWPRLSGSSQEARVIVMQVSISPSISSLGSRRAGHLPAPEARHHHPARLASGPAFWAAPLGVISMKPLRRTELKAQSLPSQHHQQHMPPLPSHQTSAIPPSHSIPPPSAAVLRPALHAHAAPAAITVGGAGRMLSLTPEGESASATAAACAPTQDGIPPHVPLGSNGELNAFASGSCSSSGIHDTSSVSPSPSPSPTAQGHRSSSTLPGTYGILGEEASVKVESFLLPVPGTRNAVTPYPKIKLNVGASTTGISTTPPASSLLKPSFTAHQPSPLLQAVKKYYSVDTSGAGNPLVGIMTSANIAREYARDPDLEHRVVGGYGFRGPAALVPLLIRYSLAAQAMAAAWAEARGDAHGDALAEDKMIADKVVACALRLRRDRINMVKALDKMTPEARSAFRARWPVAPEDRT